MDRTGQAVKNVVGAPESLEDSGDCISGISGRDLHAIAVAKVCGGSATFGRWKMGSGGRAG